MSDAWPLVEQLIIAATGSAAIWLVNDPRDAWRRWAPVVGLAGQPLWFHTTMQAGQWGVFALTLVFTAAWLRGFYNAWVRPLIIRVESQSTAPPSDEESALRSAYGCACVSRDAGGCAELRYGSLGAEGWKCQCFCHQWSDDDEYGA